MFCPLGGPVGTAPVQYNVVPNNLIRTYDELLILPKQLVLLEELWDLQAHYWRVQLISFNLPTNIVSMLLMTC